MSVGKRAASQRANPFAKGFGAPAPPAAVEAEQPATVVPPAAARDVAGKPLSVYTVRLNPETAASFDELALAARRKLGRRVDKSAIVRALVLLAADDASLRDQLID